MAKLVSQGSFFAGLIRLIPDAPIFSRGDTVEVDEPYRQSDAFIFHPWSLLTKLAELIRPLKEYSFMVGHWRVTDWDEEAALMAAVGGSRREDLDDDVADWGAEDPE